MFPDAGYLLSSYYSIDQGTNWAAETGISFFQSSGGIKSHPVAFLMLSDLSNSVTTDSLTGVKLKTSVGDREVVLDGKNTVMVLRIRHSRCAYTTEEKIV